MKKILRKNPKGNEGFQDAQGFNSPLGDAIL